MTENKMCHLPVAKDGKVVGIISASDFLKLIPSGMCRFDVLLKCHKATFANVSFASVLL
jgi:signal-transduction protein with cAMP-binding, CBS, and nucleotidyltransferase domain